jgi:hypothetical protein
MSYEDMEWQVYLIKNKVNGKGYENMGLDSLISLSICPGFSVPTFAAGRHWSV